MKRVSGLVRDGVLLLVILLSLGWTALRLSAPQPELVAEAARYRASPLTVRGRGPDTVVVWFDYECRYCLRLAAQIDTVVAEDANAPSFAYRPGVDVARPYALLVFAIAFCEAENGRGVAVHQRLRDSVIAIAADTTHRSDLHLARAVKDGAATDSLLQCATAPAMQRRLIAMAREGDRLGLSQSPALIVGTRLLLGAPSSANELRALLARR